MSDRAEAAAGLVGATFAGRFRVVQLLRSGGISDVYLAEQMTLRPGPPTFHAAEEGHESSPDLLRESHPDLPRTSTSEPPRARSEPPRARSEPPRARSEPPRASGSDHPRAGRAPRFALKVLREQHRGDRAVVRRFERGVTAAAQVVHPNVVHTNPLEHLPDGLPFCTMELLIGLDLADMLAYGRRLDPARATRIAVGAAAGLSAAHAAGVVHLDVKPENIFVVHLPDGSEMVKLLDFGLASAAGEPAPRVDAACGTPEYMAPEQRRGVAAAPTMDVYALGVVLLEMLTGDAPGEPRESEATVPPRLARIVERAIAPRAEDRFTTMDELHAALAAALEEAPAGQRVAAAR